MLFNCRRIDWSQRFDNFDLLVADALSFKRVGGLHRHQTQQLHQVVLHHIAQLPDTVVVSPATFYAHLLGHRNLYVINATLVPLRIDKPVGKPKHQQVLHGLLTEVMINAVDVSLGEEARQGLIDFA